MTELGDATHKSPYLIVILQTPNMFRSFNVLSFVHQMTISSCISHINHQSKEARIPLFDFSKYKIPTYLKLRKDARTMMCPKDVPVHSRYCTISVVSARSSSRAPPPTSSSNPPPANRKYMTLQNPTSRVLPRSTP